MKKILSLVLLLVMATFCSQSPPNDIIKLKEMVIELQNKGELGFRNFTFCSKIMGFASYVPLENSVIDKNAELLAYYEPINIFTNKNQGMYEIWFTQDMIVLDAKGGVIQEWKDIMVFHQSTRLPALDVYAQNNITLGGQLPPGKYIFKAVLKDKLSDKTATKTVEFQVK
jgi:hypothetical protein